METKRVITEIDAKKFFDSSINSIEDAFGKIALNLKHSTILFDYKSASLMNIKDLNPKVFYPFNESFFDADFKAVIHSLQTTEITETTEIEYLKQSNSTTQKFIIKVNKIHDHELELILIAYDKLFETEKQIDMLSNVIGSGNSLFSGCIWWIDYDRYDDHFYQSDTGPSLLGIPLNKDKLYNTKAFQQVREKARVVSEFYDTCIHEETKSYERLRNNQADYFGGRTPVVTNNDEIVWVEAYGKCMLRYPDGRPRFVVAVDIYMSEIYEQKIQLELLNNLIDYGLLNSDVGIWYHQRHHLEGKYYFTNSFQQLMSKSDKYKDDTITSIINKQIQLMIKDGRGYETYLQDFRNTHNRIYTDNLDKYDVIIPNFKDENTFQWIEIRGTVIKRDEEGHVLLFVGVNVDVTETYLRNRELERLKIMNERLQLAENLAIQARDLMVWYQELEQHIPNSKIYGNEMFTKKLGLKRTRDGLINYKDLRQTLVDDDPHSKVYAKALRTFFKDVYRGKKSKLNKVLAKHRNLKTGEILYIEHSLEISEYHNNGNIRLLGGILLDVTETVLYQEKIQYLADYDTLTDVKNRNYFENFIKNHLPHSYSVLVFDLDGLKLINDAFGHIEGDRIIKQLANFLKDIFTDSLFIARIGGDEFALITEDINMDRVTDKVNELEDAIDLFNIHSAIEMNVSKGGKVVVNNDISFEKAFIQAENKMYRRKLNNRKSRKSKVLNSIIETLNAKTEETYEHSERVGKLAVCTIKALGKSRASELEDIELLAKVHDVGKITIADSILKKPDTLSHEEFEIVKKHCETGYKIIRNITDSDDVCNGVLFHHEWFNGSGYPQGLKGEEIPLFARVISVVDSYDAMIHDRVYRKKISKQQAIDELIKYAGTQFDPNIVNAFLKHCLHYETNQK
jgi:diguanylate cyclase (GGDEF)-like protein